MPAVGVDGSGRHLALEHTVCLGLGDAPDAALEHAAEEEEEAEEGEEEAIGDQEEVGQGDTISVH